MRSRESVPDTFRTILYAVMIALVIRALAFEPFNIPSSSMVPGLQVGDYLFVSKFSYGYSSLSTAWGLLPLKGRIGGHPPERGDVVVFKLPTDTRTDYIKRLIGLPGEKIEVKSGVVYINDKPLARERIGPIMLEDREGLLIRPATEYRESTAEGKSYKTVQEYDNGPLDNFGPIQVPPGKYFMMGDNRNNSQDSRVASKVGFVPEENLVGRAQVTFFSLTSDASFWQFWKWPFAIRWERMFKKIV
ncbi:MAG: signal peptidase I [Alphaproteobacteria bacterium]